MRLITKITANRWHSIKGSRGWMKPEWFPDYVITLRTPDGGLFPDYIVQFHKGGGVYGDTVNYPEERWTPNKVAKAIEGNHEPATEYICEGAPRFYNKRRTEDA